MPCLTQALTTQRPATFSAARTSPRVRAARKSRKVRRASSGLTIVSAVDKCSMADFRVSSMSDIVKISVGVFQLTFNDAMAAGPELHHDRRIEIDNLSDKVH